MAVKQKLTTTNKEKKRHGLIRKNYILSDHPLQLFRPVRLAKLLDISPTTLWRWWAQEHILPPPTQVGPYIRGWRYEEVAHLLKVKPFDATR
jgi:hypothetical protein